MKVRKIRLLRQKYGITCAELGKACGLSTQRVNQLEICEDNISEESIAKLTLALELVIRKRRFEDILLWGEYEMNKDRLFELVKENANEL